MSEFKRVIFDIETNGLLPEQGAVGVFAMDRIHCLVIMDIDTGEIIDYVNHDGENDLEEGVQILMEAELLIGHNILDFDIPAIQFIYDWFQPPGRVIDTLVMTRMCFADVKEKDFRMIAKGQLEGRFLGLHGLEAWGQRLGKQKGDYKKSREEELKALHKEQNLEAPTKEELHNYVWGTWNEEMHDYCVNDVEVNMELWERVDDMKWSHEATVMEHQIHALMIQQERNGFHFDLPKAEKLAGKLQEEYDQFAEEAIGEIGEWYRPARWLTDEEEFNLDFGETKERRSWGRVDVPKRTANYDKSNAQIIEDGLTTLRASTVENCPLVKVELREFNPNSRQQIVDRLTHLYGWTPQDFTEKGNARVDDEILRNLIDDIPLAETLAEIFYFKKRIGMVADGQNGWLKLVRDDGLIHGRVNVGGTVSGRATHAAPNVSQVPGVNPKEFKSDAAKGISRDDAYQKGLDFIARHEAAGTLVSSKWKEEKEEWSILVRGREGDHGWDCRELFTVPEGYALVGCDLSGVEFRCLANLTYQFDQGELIDLVLNGDIHAKNAEIAGIGRGVAKRLLYACVPMDTKALTAAGWKTYDELAVGELILTYNAEKGMKEWKPLLEKIKYEDAPVTELYHGKNFSVRSTPNHRWFVERRVDTGKGGRQYIQTVKTTEELSYEDSIICNAPMCDENTWMDENIHTDLTKWDTDWTQQVLAMSSRERRAFLAGFCIADGHQSNSDGGVWRWNQNIGPLSEATLMASYLEWGGYVYTSTRTDTPNPMILARQNKLATVGMQRMKRRELPRQDVWCVHTENESWVMRQGDVITITGNTMYGGGLAKLGSIVEPLSAEPRQMALGKTLKAKLMHAMPSLNKAMKAIHVEMRQNQGSIAGLDGRRLFARSKHSALNLRLQSDGALIAKKWCLLVDDMFYDEGWDHGVGLDYYFCSWSHDEIQVAVRHGLEERAAEIMEQAAGIAGDHFKFRCPVEAQAVIGTNWAETH
jgi:DNA polymerase I-like protein with 3'-5' exonuclease and polymerase domains